MGPRSCRRLREETNPPKAQERAIRVATDLSRLVPEKTRTSKYAFAAADRVQIRLLYRRFWQEPADVKGWPDNQIELFDQTYFVPAILSKTPRRSAATR